ncbi:MAG TPA: sugar phosphate isomerase/epimerase family protein [Candidatus Acidoferrum sp.]|nr:sugar phosphate isomerase/epimerase family protein [Candidatus Acidoferrum sp.]
MRNNLKMRRKSRRQVLQQAAIGALAGLAWPALPQIEFLSGAATVVSGPDVKFPTAARERLAVASWPFRASIESPMNEYRNHNHQGMELIEFAARVKREFGVPGVEPLSTHFPSTDEHYLDGFRAAIDRAGVHVVDIPVDNSNSYYDANPETRARAVENGKRWVTVAVMIGSPSVRTSICEAENAKPSVDIVADELRRLVDYAAGKNVVVNLENDNLVSEDAFFLVKVIEKVNHPYLHALPDFCNSMASGNEEFNYQAVAALFPLAYNICHVKDSEVAEDGKVFRVDLKRTFGILKTSGYRGYCSMEWEGGGDPYAGTKYLIQSALENL